MSIRNYTLLRTGVILWILLFSYRSKIFGAPQGTTAFSKNLKTFGFEAGIDSPTFADFTDIEFLNENLLLVSVNQGYMTQDCSPCDTPASRVILFDLATRKVTQTFLRVDKRGAVRRISGERFAYLSASAIQTCTKLFLCGSPVNTTSPLFVSPDGNRLVVGGDRHTSRKLLDSRTLKETASLPLGSTDDIVIPGDRSLLVRMESGAFIINDGVSVGPLRFDTFSGWENNRFLSPSLLGMFVGDQSVAVVLQLDGSELFRLKVPETWKAEFIRSAGAKRFGVSRYGYSFMGYVLNPLNLLDIDGSRRSDLQTFEVYEDGMLEVLTVP